MVQRVLTLEEAIEAGWDRQANGVLRFLGGIWNERLEGKLMLLERATHVKLKGGLGKAKIWNAKGWKDTGYPPFGCVPGWSVIAALVHAYVRCRPHVPCVHTLLPHAAVHPTQRLLCGDIQPCTLQHAARSTQRGAHGQLSSGPHGEDQRHRLHVFGLQVHGR